MSKKILVIEDEKNVRENISTLLSEEGYMVLTARNGEEGIKTAKKEIPDLIISDIMMKGTDGYAVLKELGKQITTKSIPFIFLTAKVEREDLRMGMQMGADDYLFKPFRSGELLNAIDTRLKRIQALKAEINNDNGKKSTKSYGLEDKIFIRVNGNPMLIQIGEILFISAENQYTSLHLSDGKSYILRKSIAAWAKLLPEKYFFRIHRSTIININYLSRMEKWYNSSFLLYLKHISEPFVISKRYSAKLRDNSI